MNARSPNSPLALLLFLPLIFFACTTARKDPAMVSAPDPGEFEQPVVISDFFLGSGDVLEVTVYRHKDLYTKVVIPPDGTVSLPLIGDVETRNVGIRGLREKITQAYSDYLVDPKISLQVPVVKSRKVFVLGEVRRPGVVTLDRHMNVVEAIASAGGITLEGRSGDVLLLRGDTHGPTRVRSLDLSKVFKGDDLSPNVALQSRDVIYVPRTVISDVSRFATYLSSILTPVLLAQQGIAIWPAVEGVLRGDYESDLRQREGPTVVVPPGQ